MDYREPNEVIEVTLTLPKSLLVAIGVRPEDVAEAVREVVAIEYYRRGMISLGKAAEIAEVETIHEMAALLTKHDVWIHYSPNDARADATTLTNVRLP